MMPINIVKIVVSKGRSYPENTEEKNSPWLRVNYTLEAEIPDTFTRETIEETKLQLEAMINQWLEPTEIKQPPSLLTETIPNFNPDDLLKHDWKAKKLGNNEYAKGSPAWGWDFRANFKPETIKVLEKGPVTLDQYMFTLTERIVQAKKKK